MQDEMMSTRRNLKKDDNDDQRLVPDVVQCMRWRRFFVCYHHLHPRVRVTLATHSLAASTITCQPWLGFLQEFISR